MFEGTWQQSAPGMQHWVSQQNSFAGGCRIAASA
jgi:hypothetical protein